MNGLRSGLADAFALFVQIVQGDSGAADDRVGMVKEAGERFVADLVAASEVPVANKRCDDRAGRPSFAFVFEFVIEADAVHSIGMSAPSLMWRST